MKISLQFSRTVVSDSMRPPWTAALQASLSIANSRSLHKLISVMASNHLILCCPLLLPPSIFPNIRCTLVYNTWFFLHLRYVRYYPEVKDKNPTWCNRHFDKMWNQWLNINRHPEYSIPLPTPLPPLPSPLQYLSLLFVRAKSLQSCLTLCDPMDCSPPGSSVHGILQARILEWVVISFSNKVYKHA